MPASSWRPAASSKRFVACTDWVEGSLAPYGLRWFATPKPKAPHATAPITATSSTRRPLACRKSASLVNISLLHFPVVSETTLGRLAPLDQTLRGSHAEVERQAGTGRPALRVGSDRAQLRQLALAALPHLPDDLDAPFRQVVGEEQLEH